jgi:AraC-like DNA-binding protein
MIAASKEARSIEEFHSLVESSYYRSDTYLLAPQKPANFKIRSNLAGVIPVSRFTGAEVGVRREWRHIRAGASEVYVIWFPLRGGLAITQDGAPEEITQVGDFTILCGDRPFHARGVVDSADICSNVHVRVPSHLMRTHLPNVDKLCGRRFDAQQGPAKIAREIFCALHGERDLSEETANHLAIGGLRAIADGLRTQVSPDQTQLDAKKTHLARVLRYIDQNLAMQGLTVEQTAKACNLSRRYVHYLMRFRDTTFAEYLWERRLQQAHQWLADPEFGHFHIVDIAYMSGFRSASHFSNCYRNRFGHAPSEARQRPGPEVSAGAVCMS